MGFKILLLLSLFLSGCDFETRDIRDYHEVNNKELDDCIKGVTNDTGPQKYFE